MTEESFSLINRMPEIIEINKHLSIWKRNLNYGCMYMCYIVISRFSFLISVRVFNYNLP